jgi:hypothetical protein
MATYTLPLKKVIKLTGGTVEIVDGVRVMTGGNIGLNDYPIFNSNAYPDGSYRPILNGKIIDHYWNREIGLETIEMFQLAMRRRMNEIMPVINKMYESLEIEFNPLSTVDIQTESTTEADVTNTSSGSNNTSSENSSESRTVLMDTPQMRLAGNKDYATSSTDNTGSATVEGSVTEESTFNSDGETTVNSRTTGYQGVASDLLTRYRQSLINPDMMVINALEDCFMLVWDNGDTFTRGYYF